MATPYRVPSISDIVYTRSRTPTPQDITLNNFISFIEQSRNIQERQSVRDREESRYAERVKADEDRYRQQRSDQIAHRNDLKMERERGVIRDDLRERRNRKDAQQRYITERLTRMADNDNWIGYNSYVNSRPAKMNLDEQDRLRYAQTGIEGEKKYKKEQQAGARFARYVRGKGEDETLLIGLGGDFTDTFMEMDEETRDSYIDFEEATIQRENANYYRDRRDDINAVTSLLTVFQKTYDATLDKDVKKEIRVEMNSLVNDLKNFRSEARGTPVYKAEGAKNPLLTGTWDTSTDEGKERAFRADHSYRTGIPADSDAMEAELVTFRNGGWAELVDSANKTIGFKMNLNPALTDEGEIPVVVTKTKKEIEEQKPSAVSTTLNKELSTFIEQGEHRKGHGVKQFGSYNKDLIDAGEKPESTRYIARGRFFYLPNQHMTREAYGATNFIMEKIQQTHRAQQKASPANLENSRKIAEETRKWGTKTLKDSLSTLDKTIETVPVESKERKQWEKLRRRIVNTLSKIAFLEDTERPDYEDSDILQRRWIADFDDDTPFESFVGIWGEQRRANNLPVYEYDLTKYIPEYRSGFEPKPLWKPS